MQTAGVLGDLRTATGGSRGNGAFSATSSGERAISAKKLFADGQVPTLTIAATPSSDFVAIGSEGAPSNAVSPGSPGGYPPPVIPQLSFSTLKQPGQTNGTLVTPRNLAVGKSTTVISASNYDNIGSASPHDVVASSPLIFDT